MRRRNIKWPFAQKEETTVFLLSCITASSSASDSPEGQFSGGKFNHGGPSHHLEFRSWRTEHPRLGRSAGFITPGTWRHASFIVKLLITYILFHTKTAHESSLWIQAITVEESLQKKSDGLSCSISFFTETAYLALVVAANSSNLGIVSCLNGDTQDLACTN